MALPAWLRNVAQIRMATVVVGIVFLGVGGCANEQPKPAAPPMTPEHVRGHADKAFGDLKQEERRQGSEPGGTSY